MRHTWRVRELVAGERWVVDGNYGSRVQDLVWDAADTVVWLDLPRRAILPRLAARTLRRMWNREELWNGNRERWSNLFDPRPDRNILIWMWTRHGPQRSRNAAALADDRWAHLQVHRLRSPAEVETFHAASCGRAISPVAQCERPMRAATRGSSRFR